VVLLTTLEIRDLEVLRGSFHLGPIGLDAAGGEATVVLGPSGAGKTTLLRAVAGFLPLRGGTIRVDGSPIDRRPPERRGLGFVPPDLGLFPHLRVRANVRYPLALKGEPDRARRAETWLERFRLGALADRYPAELSSGERQRVAMARALAAEPRVLLWDEPLAALDVESRDELLRLLRDLLEAERLPLLLVTHDPAVAFGLASRLVVLEAGRARFDGAPEALAAGRLDRFSARFLGYENLYSLAELEAARDANLAPRLLSAAGSEGIVVPADAVRWARAAEGGPRAEVAAVRWTAAGWVVAFRDGSLTVRSGPSREPPGVRVGDRVSLRIEPDGWKPLGDPLAGGPR
jgi:ABC-type Fe3+/spermidine/putrescine transport system ATPase subunit